MRPLTDHTPKPLLPVAGKPLLEHHIVRLRKAGITDLVINHAHLGEQIEDYFGDGNRFGVSIRYSPESRALETAGGIRNALPLLGEAPFIVVNGDVWTDFPLVGMCDRNIDLAHLVLVENPVFNKQGDFCLGADGAVCEKSAAAQATFTFSGVSLLAPALFADCPPGAVPLLPIFQEAMRKQAITGEVYRGAWFDVGTPDRLRALEDYLRARQSLRETTP